MSQLAHDIKHAMSLIQKYSNSPSKDGITKLEHAVKLFTLTLDHLNSLPENEKNSTLKELGDARFQIDQTLENIAHKHANLKEQILTEIKKAQAQKGYAQYIK